MCLFLEVHELDGSDAEALVQPRSVQAPRGVRLPTRQVTELFAPAERWMSYDSIAMA